MSERNLALPTAKDWLDLGVRIDKELHAGKQSRVFTGKVDNQRIALKLTDAGLADRALLARRALMTEHLGDVIECVLGPVRIEGHLVQPVGEWFVTATPFVDGQQLDVTNRSDAQLMGMTLSQLHEALASLSQFELPPVRALDVDDAMASDDWQMLHGDFSDQNIIVTSTGPKVFDFDDCGFGPVEYDLANSLYMVLFDSEVNGTLNQYELFRPAFLDGYAIASGKAVDHLVVDSLIGTRIEALGRWLNDLPNAPIGIQTSSAEWLETLGAFVASHNIQRSNDSY